MRADASEGPFASSYASLISSAKARLRAIEIKDAGCWGNGATQETASQRGALVLAETL